MGGVMPAGARGVDAAWYNPAGLGWVGHREIAGSYQAMVEDINQGTFGYAQPVGGRFGVAVFASYLDYGNQDRSTLSTAGAFVTVNRAGSFSAADVAGGLAIGGRLSENLAGGLALKVINSKLDNASATAFAADLGAKWKLGAELPVSIGAVVRNIGTELKYDRVEEKLPFTWQLGARGDFFEERLGINIACSRTRQDDIQLHAGAEVRPFGPILALRVGYDGVNDVGNGLTAGLGVTINAFTLDYAYIPFEKFGDNHRVGLTYRF
jgi:hypothetical protein